MERTLIGDLGQKAGETVSISGWVVVRRDQGRVEARAVSEAKMDQVRRAIGVAS